MKVIELVFTSGKMGKYKAMKKMSFVLIACVLWFLLIHNQKAIGETEPFIYDLSMCIESALKNHPSLRQSQYMIKYYEHGVDAAKRQFRPHLLFHSSAVRFESEKEFAPLLSISGTTLVTREASGTKYVAGLTLSQPIYTEGSLLGFSAPGIKREKNNFIAQKFTNLKLKADVIYDVSEAYGEVLKTLKSLKVEEANLKTSELIFDTALAKYKLDMINKKELIEAEDILVNQKAKINELKSKLEVNLSNLANKIGFDGKISKISTDISRFRGILCDTESIPPLEKLYEIAYQKRDDIKAEEVIIESLRNNLNVVKSKRYPELSLKANYFRTGDIDFDDNSYAWNVLIRLDMTLFDFGETSAEVSQQKNMVYAQKEALRALKNDITFQIQESYQKIQRLKATLIGLQKSKEVAKEALALTQEKYRKELIAELELLMAQDTLAQVEQAIYETEIDLIVTLAALKKSVGLDITECTWF